MKGHDVSRSSALERNERFLDALEHERLWLNSGYLDRCDKCGSNEPEPLYLGQPPDILLNVCWPCSLDVQREMRKPGAGYLGDIMRRLFPDRVPQ